MVLSFDSLEFGVSSSTIFILRVKTEDSSSASAVKRFPGNGINPSFDLNNPFGFCSLDLKGTVIVTGGNRGIGLELSKACAQAGADIAIIYHSAKDAPEVAEKVAKEFGIKCKAYQCDVGDQATVIKTFDTIHKEMGEVTGLVANAGVSVVAKALDLTPDDFHKVFNVNVLGVFNTACAAQKLWEKSQFKTGSVVITSSMSSQIINVADGPAKTLTQTFYNSSKAAVSSVCKTLASEWAAHGTRVNCLCPGYVATDQTSHMPEELKHFQASTVPLKRFARPDEMAGMTVLLLSDKATYMTGTEYFVDGGSQIF